MAELALLACPPSATPAPPVAFSNQIYPMSACLAATTFLQGHPSQQGPVWTSSSGQAEEVQDEGKAPEMPSRGASFRSRVQLVVSGGLPASSLPQGWSMEAHRLPISGAGIAQKPPGCPMCSPARDFLLGLYVPCCRIQAGRAAGQWGEELITTTTDYLIL